MRRILIAPAVFLVACSAGPSVPDASDAGASDAGTPMWRALVGRFLGEDPHRTSITVITPDAPARHVELAPPGGADCTRYNSQIDRLGEHLLVSWISNRAVPECPHVVALHDPSTLAERPGQRVILSDAPLAAALATATKLYVLGRGRVTAIDLSRLTVTATIGLDGLLDEFHMPRALLAAGGVLYVVGRVPDRSTAIVAIDVATDTVVDLDPAQPGVQPRTLALPGVEGARLASPTQMVVLGSGMPGNPRSAGLAVVELPSLTASRTISFDEFGGTPDDVDFLDDDTAVVATTNVIDPAENMRPVLRLVSLRDLVVVPAARVTGLVPGRFSPVRVVRGAALLTVYRRRVGGADYEDVVEVWSLDGQRLQEVPLGRDYIATSIEL